MEITNGRAEKGSQRCLQDWVNDRGTDLANLIITASPSLMAFGAERVTWKSPLENEKYQEYRDDFLVPLELQEQHNEARKRFWPAMGPKWDGLAVVETRSGQKGYILLEAKGHPAETESTMGAKAQDSIDLITESVGKVQAHMGATGANWLSGTYQLANRLAFLYWLNVERNVPAWLVLVNFVDDQDHKPTSPEDWRKHYVTIFHQMHIHPGAPLLDRVVTVFPVA